MKPEVPNAPTMSCPDPEILMRWLDDELDPSERLALDAHFDSCRTCAKRVAASGDS